LRGRFSGGLDAYTAYYSISCDMGVAIVIVNHLRTVATLLHEILPRYTGMPVELITERLLIQPTMCSSSRRSAICTFLMASSV